METLISTILASTFVSAAVSFVLKTWFEAQLKHFFEREIERLRHTYEIEIERLKYELDVRTDIVCEITERRFKTYPRIVELIYRIRNLSREIIHSTNIRPILIDELEARVKELENSIYVYRFDLERDGIFTAIHSYKNSVIVFNKAVSEYLLYQGNGETASASQTYARIRALYTEIDQEHRVLIEDLSKFGVEDSISLSTAKS